MTFWHIKLPPVHITCGYNAKLIMCCDYISVINDEQNGNDLCTVIITHVMGYSDIQFKVNYTGNRWRM